MGNYGCCQSSTIVAEELKYEYPPELTKKIDIFTQNEINEPGIIESNEKASTLKRKHKTTKKILLNGDKEKKSQKEALKNHKSDCFDKGDFVNVIQGDIEKQYSIMSQIRKANPGLVYKANHKISNTLRAVKIIKKCDLKPETLQKLMEEVKVLKSFDHPNIIKVYEVYENNHSINIITELCTGGELFDRIIACKNFSENKAALYLYQIMSAVLACHEKGIVHRDLKPENMVFSSESEESSLKIIDFGTSKKIEPNATLSSLTGTVIIYIGLLYSSRSN